MPWIQLPLRKDSSQRCRHVCQSCGRGFEDWSRLELHQCEKAERNRERWRRNKRKHDRGIVRRDR